MLPQPPAEQASPLDPKKTNEEFRTRIDASKRYRRKLIPAWTANIDYRRGKPFQTHSDEDRIFVNLDWSMTKSKQAALFSQIPQIRIDHPPQTINSPWIFSFEQRVNDTIIQAGIETAMEECLPDCINAAGIAAVICSHESITEQVQVPALDLATLPPEVAQSIQSTGKFPDGSEVPTINVPRVVDHRYITQRISPSDLLLPINFTGADFDNAPWIGRSGRMPWAQAMSAFNLTEADKRTCLGGSDRTSQDRLTNDLDKEKMTADEMVEFDEIFYKEFQFDPSAKSYFTLHHLVFVTGRTEPVIDEPWKGQKFDSSTNQLTGAIKFPIRVLTLTYITDETIPPSDSAITRPQINEINKSRTQMVLQRERSLPVRWFNINGIDTAIQQSLMRGTWQAMIPVQGDGSRLIGEVARASMPQDDYTFDTIAKNDISDLLGMGPNQQGNFGKSRTSASEANVVESNYQTRIGKERARVAKFFVSIAEVIGGLLCLYEDPSAFGKGFDPSICKALSYSILADSTVMIDSNQRLERLMNFINQTAKSGFVNIEPVLKEIATLSGLDPNVVIKAPEPKPPVEPNISLRLSGAEDIMNPLILAMLMGTGQAPSAELIEQAKQLIMTTMLPAPGQPPIPNIPGSTPPPQLVGPDGQPLPQPIAPPPTSASPVPPPNAPPEPVGEAHPSWSGLPRVNKRTESEE